MTRECEFPSFSPSSDETQQQEIRRWMYVNRWAIVNHDNSRDIYQSGLFPINSLFSIPRWKKSFGDGSSKGGGGPVGAVVEFYTSTRHHVHVFFRFNDEDPCSRSSFFTIPFSLSLSFLFQARMRSTPRRSHRASALTVAPST